VAVSAVTTFTTPYQILYSDRIYSWVSDKLPPSFKQRLVRYESAVSNGSGQGLWGLVWQEYGMKVVLNSVVVIAIGLLGSQVAFPWVQARFGNELWVSITSCLFTLSAAAPFFWAIVVGPPAHSEDYPADTVERLRRLQLGILIVRVLFGVTLTGFVVSRFVPVQAVYAIFIVFVSIIGLFFSRYAEPLYRAFEARFLSNLNEKEREEASKTQGVPVLTPWEASLAEFVLSPNSDLVAKTLEQCRLKERFGLTVAMIRRGNRTLLTPGRGDLLLPHDRLYLIGTDEQLAAGRPAIEVGQDEEDLVIPEAFGLASLTLKEGSEFTGRPIRECGLRERVQGLIVGIERRGERILSPDSSLVLTAGDLVWLVGDRAKIRALR